VVPEKLNGLHLAPPAVAGSGFLVDGDEAFAVQRRLPTLAILAQDVRVPAHGFINTLENPFDRLWPLSICVQISAQLSDELGDSCLRRDVVFLVLGI
jgi:hypothetical protein